MTDHTTTCTGCGEPFTFAVPDSDLGRRLVSVRSRCDGCVQADRDRDETERADRKALLLRRGRKATWTTARAEPSRCTGAFHGEARSAARAGAKGSDPPLNDPGTWLRAGKTMCECSPPVGPPPQRSRGCL